MHILMSSLARTLVSCSAKVLDFNPFVLEFIIPAELLIAADKTTAPEKYSKRAHNVLSSSFF